PTFFPAPRRNTGATYRACWPGREMVLSARHRRPAFPIYLYPTNSPSTEALLLSVPGRIRRFSGLQGGSMWDEFKEFIARGNVMDLAVAVIIGGAFGLIVSSLTDDIIMPVVGAIFGGFDFSNYFLPLSSNVTATTLEAAREQGAVLAYGNFITVVLNFLILAWIIFLMVKGVNNLRRQQTGTPAEPEAPPQDIQL